MKTPLQKIQDKTNLANKYRHEAQTLFNLASPTRQGFYIKARLSGKTPEQAIKLASPNRKG